MSEYKKVAGLQYSPIEMARMASRAPDSFLNSIGRNYVIGLDSDIDRLNQAMKQVYARVGRNVPSSSTFFDAISEASRENQNWNILKYGLAEGAKDIGAGIYETSVDIKNTFSFLAKAAPLVALVFIGGYLFTQYKKVTK